MNKLAILLVRFYQLAVSPWLGNNCRFLPSCSAYAIEAFETHGFLRGSYYTLRRLLKCHPFCHGGVDLVPALKKKQKQL